MKYFIPLCLLILSSIIFSCNKNVSVKVMEEHDPVVKILEERDSMIVFPKDSVVRKPKK